MQSNKIKKFHLLKRLLKNQLDAAATKYSTAAKMLESELIKQQQLQNYKQHYNQDLFKSNTPTVNINSVKQKLNFIAYIEQILSAQQTSIENLKKDVDLKKSVWLHFRNRFNKLSEYIENLENQSLMDLEVREQKDLDTLVNDLYEHQKNVER